jgi:hypothetical protein
MEQMLRAYKWLFQSPIKEVVTAVGAVAAAGANAYYVGRINDHDSALNAPAIIKVISAGLHVPLTVYGVSWLARRANSERIAQFSVQGANLAYNLLECGMYVALGASHPLLSVLPSYIVNMGTMGAYAYVMRREKTIPEQLRDGCSAAYTRVIDMFRSKKGLEDILK